MNLLADEGVDRAVVERLRNDGHDVLVAESDEDKPGVILDYDEQGNLMSLKILDTSKRVTEARKIEFQTTE